MCSKRAARTVVDVRVRVRVWIRVGVGFRFGFRLGSGLGLCSKRDVRTVVDVRVLGGYILVPRGRGLDLKLLPHKVLHAHLRARDAVPPHCNG